MLRRFFVFFERAFHMIFITSPLSPSSLLLLPLSHLFFSLRFLLWSFLSLFCVVAAAALLPLLLVLLLLVSVQFSVISACVLCHSGHS